MIGLSMLMEVQQYSIGRDSIPRGRMAKMVEARDRFICEGGFGGGLSRFGVGEFSGLLSVECEPGGAESIGELIELGKSGPKFPLIV